MRKDKDSTWKIRPTSKVKKPRGIFNHKSRDTIEIGLPLVLDNIVALATLVESKLALTLQLAMNQKMQKIEASFAVSLIVRGSSSFGEERSSDMMDGARKLVMMLDVGASRASVTGIDS